MLRATPGIHFVGNVEGHDLALGHGRRHRDRTASRQHRAQDDEARSATPSPSSARPSPPARWPGWAPHAAWQELKDCPEGSTPRLRRRGPARPQRHGSVVAHGASKAASVSAACELAAHLSRKGIVARIGERLSTAPRPHRLW
ncbi:hypothetical protein [Nonomuraea dietziae]|uniref:hypothetical protein n=1 Tax=Nonomuraea dietziae TaxID=65515 RepID=UPI0031D71272